MIALSLPNLTGREWEYVKECIDTGWISTSGSFVGRFEREFAEYVGSDSALSVMNGTAALHVALQMLEVKVGDLVVMPNVTFVASANAVSYVGADPILIDINKDTWQMDLDLLEEFLRDNCERLSNGDLIQKTSGRKVSAIMIVHVQGNICDMNRINQICVDYSLPLLEDAAEALGSQFEGKFAGTFGQLGCFSFNGNKIMSTGGGGMLIAKDEQLLLRARHISTTAKTDPFAYFHDEVGYNYRLVNVLAAIGVAQLEQLNNFVQAKRKTASYYREMLGGVGDIGFQHVADNVLSNEWLFTITTDRMNELLSYLNQNKVMSRPFWTPMNQLPMYEHCKYIYRDDISADVHKKAISIPCSTGITSKELNTVVENIKTFFR